MDTLAAVLGRTGAESFARAYPVQWLHLPGDPARRIGFGWDDVNEVLRRATLPCPWVNIVIDGQRTQPADLDDLAVGVRAGHTLVVRHLERVHDGINAVTDGIAAELGEPTAANLYLSQPGHQGFNLHYDSHDVLVFHLAGTKTWEIHPRLVPYLVSGSSENERRTPDGLAPLARITLDPGDILYLPRGQWHAAVADTESLHLTVGIYPRTGLDLLAFLIEHLKADVDLRRPAPPERLPSGAMLGPAKRAHLDHVLTVLRDALATPGIIEAYEQQLTATAVSRPTHLFPASPVNSAVQGQGQSGP